MRLIAFAAACLFTAASASAQDKKDDPASRPQVLTRVLDCRTVQTAAERLACYDREVAAFAAAEAAQDLVVYDREQMRRTRRSLFGIPLPSLAIFGGGNDGKDESEDVSQIETTIRSARQDAEGRYTFTLEDGARWQQIDTRIFSARPRPGQAIRIRRAAMGSYLANVGSQVAVRVRRVLPAD